MKPAPLPYNALPLSFELLASLSASTFSSPLCCITAQLPFRPHPDAPPLERDAVHLAGEHAAVQVVRILDPEHREPFVSLSRIFLACSLSPLEGLVRFKLRRPGYDSSLGGLAPWNDIWVPLPEARRVAKALGVDDELAALLEWETRSAWSVEDKEEGGLVHNWKIQSDVIDPQRYSTEAMLSTPFPRLHLLPSKTQVRTLTSPNATTSPSPSTVVPTFASLHSHLTSWTILEYESFLSDEEDSPHPLPPPPPSPPNLTLTSLSTTLSSLLSLLSLVPPSSDHLNAPSGTIWIAGTIPAERKDVAAGTGRAKVALVDALGRLVGREWRMSEEEKIKRDRLKDGNGDEVWEKEGEGKGKDWEGEVEERLRAIEDTLVKVGKKSGGRREAGGEAAMGEVEKLRERVEEMERRQRRSERASARDVDEQMALVVHPRQKVGWVGWLNFVLVGFVAVLLVPYVKPIT